MAFRGWPAEAIDFYEGLEADNSKAYWQEHKAVYESAVLAPMEQLLSDLAGDFGEGKIFRPYRDTRFSADKTPYKTAIAATLPQGGYVQFSADGLGAGAGFWHMAADQLERYRKAVDDDRVGTDLERIADKLRAGGIDVSAHGSLKTAPRGYAKDHRRIDLLRQKGLVAWKQWPPAAWIGTPKAKQRIVDFMKAAAPLVEWLDTNVGETTVVVEDWRRR